MCWLSGQANLRKTNTGKSKVNDVKVVKSSLESKIIDAELHSEKARRDRDRERKKFEDNYGKTSTKYNNFIRRMKKRADDERESIKERNKTKLEHLKAE